MCQPQTRLIPVLLIISSVSALAYSFTMFTAIRLLVDNMGLSFSMVSYLLGAASFIDSLWATAVSPILDRLPLLPLALGASAMASFFRLCLVGLVFFLPRFWQLCFVFPLFMFMTTSDGLSGRAIELQLKRTADATGRLFSSNGESELSNRLFGVRYSLGNVAAFLGTVTFAVLRSVAPTVGTANALIQVAGAGAGLIVTLFIYLAYRMTKLGLYQTTTPQPIIPSSAESSSEDNDAPVSSFTSQSVQPVVHIPTLRDELNMLIRDRTLWRYTAFSLCLSGARSIMTHMETTLSEIMIRLFGDEVQFSGMQAINPGLVFFGAPIAQHYTAKYNGYWVIAIGTFISAISVLPLATINPTTSNNIWFIYLPYVLFVTIFSVGESIWSARLTAYALSIAPTQQRASYLALSSIPLLAVRFVAAWHSGWLVETYCPVAGGPAHCASRTLWIWVMMFGLLTPLLLVVFRRWLDANRQHQQKQLLLQTQTRVAVMESSSSSDK